MFKKLLFTKTLGHSRWMVALLAVLLIAYLFPAAVSQAGDRTSDVDFNIQWQRYNDATDQYETVTSSTYLEHGDNYRFNVHWEFANGNSLVTNDTLVVPVRFNMEYGSEVIFDGETIFDFTYGIPVAKVGEFSIISIDSLGNPDGRDIQDESGEFFALEIVFTEDYLSNLNNVQGDLWLEFTLNEIVITEIDGGGEAYGTNNQIMLIKHDEQGQPLIGAKFQVQVFAPNGSEKFIDVLDLSTIHWGVSEPLGVYTADDRIIITEIDVPKGYLGIPVPGQQFTLHADPALGYALTSDTLKQLEDYDNWLTVSVNDEEGLITATLKNIRETTGSGSGTYNGGSGGSNNYPNLSTLAKGIFNGQSLIITDTVTYKNLTVGKTYTMTGILMNPDGTEFLADGSLITVTRDFTPETAKGELEMVFPAFNVEKLSGQKVVVYEVLTRDSGSVVAKHENPKDPKQTVDLSGPGGSPTGDVDNPGGSQDTGYPETNEDNPGEGTNFGQPGTFDGGTNPDGNNGVPATGDDNRLIYWIMVLALASVTAIYGLNKSVRRRKSL